MTAEKLEILRNPPDMPLADVAFPMLPNPTITLYRERFIEFNESLKEAISFCQIVTGQERPSRVSLAAWILQQDDEELHDRARQHPWVVDAVAFIDMAERIRAEDAHE